MTVLYAIIALIVAAVIVAKLYLCIAGKEKIVVKTDAPFVVESQTDDAIVISKKLTFVNEGKQCATIMDALVRPQLPYEQYDGIEARGKAEREGEPRGRLLRGRADPEARRPEPRGQAQHFREGQADVAQGHDAQGSALAHGRPAARCHLDGDGPHAVALHEGPSDALR